MAIKWENGKAIIGFVVLRAYRAGQKQEWYWHVSTQLKDFGLRRTLDWGRGCPQEQNAQKAAEECATKLIKQAYAELTASD